MTEELVLNPQQELTEEERKKVDTIKNSIDLSKSDQIIQYGTASQTRMTGFADSVLNNVRSKDMGKVGDLLAGLSADIRYFDSAVNKKSFFGLFNSLKRKLARMRGEFSKVEANISKVERALDNHSKTLLKDIYMFDQQYKENWNFFREISIYIQAGEEKIAELNNEVLPRLRTEVEASQDPQQLQMFRDMEQRVDRFEKKVHDLKLSRMISVQLAPQIRMIQNNSALLIDKIQSAIANTIPLWKNQMVISLGLVHAQQALQAQKMVTDATNELLRKNSEMMKQSTINVATESERGIVDIETIKKANEDLFTAMDELARIQKEGRERRIAAEIELKAVEDELKKRLLAERRL